MKLWEINGAMRQKFSKQDIPLAPDLRFELELWAIGCLTVAGVDEAGRGALAGPVSAAVLILPVDPLLDKKLAGVRDSKEMRPAARLDWAQQIKEIAVGYGVGFADNLEIDTLGIVPATYLAIQRAFEQLATPPQHLLTDYLNIPQIPLPQTALIKGDARSLSIAGASILAKTARDALMCHYDETYPGYAFRANKGYGTQLHRRALVRLGPSPLHRASFSYKTSDLN